MTKYKVAVAFLSGSGFTALLLLLLKVSSASVLSAFLGLFLLPGGVLADLIFKPKEFSPPLAVFAANGLVYTGVAYAALSILCRNAEVVTLRTAMVRMLFPVAILVGLACTPALNPLWPRGMTALARQEKTLQEALPVGTGLEGARAVLRSNGVQFREEVETSEVVLLKRQDRSMTAAAGDRVISARIETEASQFPCGYEIEAVLLFGPDEKLKDNYVHRLRLCP